jgi:hypothetical protein
MSQIEYLLTLVNSFSVSTLLKEQYIISVNLAQELDVRFLLFIMTAALFMPSLLFFLLQKKPFYDAFSFVKNLGLKIFLSRYEILSKLSPCIVPLNIMFSFYCSWTVSQKFSAVTHELLLVKEQVSAMESQLVTDVPINIINPVLSVEPVKPFFDSNFLLYMFVGIVVLGVIYYFASSSSGGPGPGPGPGPSSGFAPSFEQSLSTVEVSTITTALADPVVGKGLLKAGVKLAQGEPGEHIKYHCDFLQENFPEYFNAENFPQYFPHCFPI